MAKMIAASFDDLTNANSVIRELEEMGYELRDFSIITTEEVRAAISAGGGTDHTVGEGAASGVAAGGVIGGVAGLLAGAGVLPALAGLLIGGPVVAALGATGLVAATISGAVTGAATGGLIGTLTHLGIPEETARDYEEVIESGGTFFGVPVKDLQQEEDVRTIFTDHGAANITEFTI